MRYLVGFVLVAALVASPLRVSAQEDSSGALAEDLQEEAGSASDAGDPTPSSEHVEPDLSPRVHDRTRRNWDPNTYELRLDSSGVSVAPPSPPDWREDPRLRKHRQGMIVSSVVFGLGIAGVAGGIVLAQNAEPAPDEIVYIPVGPIVLASFGAAMALAGLVGIAISGSRFSKRKQELRSRANLEPGKRHRVQWDPHISRFVF